MKYDKQILIVCLAITIALELQAQSVATTSGGVAMGSYGLVCYTVGQIANSTITGSNGSVAQGVQQPFEIWVITGTNNSTINLNISAYPNPTYNYLSLKVDDSGKLNIQSMSYQLFDVHGKLLRDNELTTCQTQIDMSGLIPSTYFLKVMKNKKLIKTFKLIKN